MLRNRLKQRQRLQFGKVGLWLQLGLNSKSVLEVLTATIPGNVLQQPYEPCSTTNPSYKKDHPCGNLILLITNPQTLKGQTSEVIRWGFSYQAPWQQLIRQRGQWWSAEEEEKWWNPCGALRRGPGGGRGSSGALTSVVEKNELLVGPSWVILRIPCEISPQLEDKSGKE